MCVISNAMVSEATTEETREEFLALSTKLADISSRAERVAQYNINLETLSDNSKHVAQLFSAKEQQHIDHVRETMKAISEFKADRKPHDFTKDALYFFVTSAKFACGVKGEGLDKLFELEVERHYTEEAHHPQFEGINNKECDSGDIREMAVDRMSRSIQSNGSVIMDDMEKYLPVFELGDNTAKQALYRQFVNEHKELTEKVYSEMFSATKKKC